MADTNRVGLAYAEEATWGTNPGTALTEINYTGESLTFNIANITSNSIRSDRQVTDLIQTGADCGGGIDFELQANGYDDFLVGALWATDWVGVGGGTTETITSGATASNLDFTLSSANNTITFGSGVTHGIKKGHWFKLAGSTSDDGYHQATAVSGQEITVASITGDEVLDETDLAKITGGNLRNGITRHSYYIERAHSDVTQFFQFSGMVVNTMSLDVSANSIMTGAFEFIGKKGTLTQTTAGTGTNNAASTADYMNAVANVGDILIDGTAASAGLINSLTVEVNNNVRGQTAVGVLGYSNISVGEVLITGDLNLHFIDETYYDLYLAGTAFSLSWRVTDSSGNSFIFTLPNCKFVSSEATVGGKNQDLLQSCSYQAIMDATDLYTIQITRL